MYISISSYMKHIQITDDIYIIQIFNIYICIDIYIPVLYSAIPVLSSIHYIPNWQSPCSHHIHTLIHINTYIYMHIQTNIYKYISDNYHSFIYTYVGRYLYLLIYIPVLSSIHYIPNCQSPCSHHIRT
jgi:hypothetical protein